MIKQLETKQVKCDHCGGTGIYQRHTSYTINGVPVCFRCGGSGILTVKITKRRLDRQAKWQIVGPFSSISIQNHEPMASEDFPY